MPRAELHLHIDGILHPALAAELEAEGLDLKVDLEVLRACCPVAGQADWQKYGELSSQVPKEAQFQILGGHLRGLARQGLSYCEIMVNGMLFAKPTLDETLELFRYGKALADKASGPGLQTEFLVAIARGKVEKVENQVGRAIEVFKAGLVKGLALAGDDSIPLQPHIPALARAKAAGMGIEIHCGELAGPEDVRAALDSGLADRLGHAVSAFQEPELIERILKSGLHVELCPSSNIRLGAVKSLAEHPIRKAREWGMNYSVNTDDPGAFGCSMDSEWAKVRAELGFSDEDEKKVFANCMKSAFGERKAS